MKNTPLITDSTYLPESSSSLGELEESEAKRTRLSRDTQAMELQTRNRDDGHIEITPASITVTLKDEKIAITELFLGTSRNSEQLKSLDNLLKENFNLDLLANFNKARYLSIIAELCKGKDPSEFQHLLIPTSQRKRSKADNHYPDNPESRKRNAEKNKRKECDIRERANEIIDILSNSLADKEPRQAASKEVTTILDQLKTHLIEQAQVKQKRECADQVSESQGAPKTRSTPRENAGKRSDYWKDGFIPWP